MQFWQHFQFFRQKTKKNRWKLEFPEGFRSFRTLLFPRKCNLQYWQQWSIFYAEIQKLSTQTPKTKRTWKKFRNKCSKHSSGHECCSFVNRGEIFKPFRKIKRKLTHNREKTTAELFSTKPFFTSIQFFGQIDCSFVNFADHLLPKNWEFFLKGLWVFQVMFSLLSSFEHVIWFFDNTVDCLLPKT